MNKRDLIYQAASEGVMISRLELNKYLETRLDKAELNAVDIELSKAMGRAGNYALLAYDADCRKISSVPMLLHQSKENK